MIDNFRRSQCKFLIASTTPEITANLGGFTGGNRSLNLSLPPFDLPEPIGWIDDHYLSENRMLGVWSREQLAAQIGPG